MTVARRRARPASLTIPQEHAPAAPADPVASPKMKQGRISEYFGTRHTPARKTVKDLKESTPKSEKAVGGLVAAASVDEKHEPAQETPVSKRNAPVIPAETRSSLLYPEADPVSVAILDPAHERLADYLVPSGITRLSFPEPLKLLQRIHAAMESVCQLAADRDQPAIFHRIKKAAENIVGREITLEHMKQIHWAMPSGSYVFRPVQTVHLGRRIQSYAIEFGKKLSHVDLTDRREAFHAALLEHVKSAHAKFLTTIGVELPEGAKIRSWHPKFPLESTPELPFKELVEVKEEHVAPTTPSVIFEAMLEAASEKQAKLLERKEPETPIRVAKKDDTVSALEPKKMSLLERIKAKEQQAQTEQMLASSKSSAAADELTVLSSFIESLSFCFSSAGKGALPLGDISTKLTLGSKVPIAPTDIANRLDRLVALVPEWIQMNATGRAVIVKIDRKQPVKTVITKLTSALQS